MEILNIALSPSQYTLWQECETKANYIGLQKLMHINGPAKWLGTGSLYHVGQAAYYNAMKGNAPFPERVSLAIDKQRTYFYEKSENLTAEDLAEVIKVSNQYWDFYSGEWLDVIGTEEAFSYIAHEGKVGDDIAYRIILRGKIDLIVKLNSGLTPWDHKSSGRKTTHVELNNQCLIYLLYLNWFLTKNHEEFPIKDFIINNIGSQKTVKLAEKFNRETLSYNDDNLLEFREDLIHDVENNLIPILASGNFPKRRSNCWNCQFHEICKTDKKIRQWKLEKLYTKRPDYNLFDEESE